MSEEKQRYRMTFHCACGATFRKITTDLGLTSPPCPECKKKNKKLRLNKIGDGPVSESDLIAEKVAQKLRETPEWQKEYMSKVLSPTPPEMKNRNKAVDITADIVMQDYKLGDLKDNVRMGESMAPKLPGLQQSMADQMMSGGKGDKTIVWDANNRRPVAIPNNAKRGAALARAAMSGSLRDKNYRDPMSLISQQTKPAVRDAVTGTKI